MLSEAPGEGSRLFLVETAGAVLSGSDQRFEQCASPSGQTPSAPLSIPNGAFVEVQPSRKLRVGQTESQPGRPKAPGQGIVGFLRVVAEEADDRPVVAGERPRLAALPRP